jgi:hypothetical protein
LFNTFFFIKHEVGEHAGPRVGGNVDISDAEQLGWIEVCVKNKQSLVLKRQFKQSVMINNFMQSYVYYFLILENATKENPSMLTYFMFDKKKCIKQSPGAISSKTISTFPPTLGL